LSAEGKVSIGKDMIERDVGSKAPVNLDGTLNLVVCGAWLLREEW